jgi:hypothetical protein
MAEENGTNGGVLWLSVGVAGHKVLCLLSGAVSSCNPLLEGADEAEAQYAPVSDGVARWLSKCAT